MQVAAELFPIRYVCAFGNDLPDGVVPLDDVFALDQDDLAQPPARPGNAAAHVAAITFDSGADGIVPVARNHLELVAGGLAPYLESGAAADASILSAIPPSSFAGMALTLLPWLLERRHALAASCLRSEHLRRAMPRAARRLGRTAGPGAFRHCRDRLSQRPHQDRARALAFAGANGNQPRRGAAKRRWSMSRALAKSGCSPPAAATTALRRPFRRHDRGAARRRRRGRVDRMHAHRRGHAGAARTDGAGARISSRRRERA